MTTVLVYFNLIKIRKKKRDERSENEREQIQIITSLSVKRLERFLYSFFFHVN